MWIGEFEYIIKNDNGDYAASICYSKQFDYLLLI